MVRMSAAGGFLTYTDARKRLRQVLDRASAGVPVGIRSRDRTVTVVAGEALRRVLRSSPQLPRPAVVAENGGWSVLLAGTPVAAEGSSLDEAVGEFVIALREYGEDWEERLHAAPNHRSNWVLVCFLGLMSDSELEGWIVGSPR